MVTGMRRPVAGAAMLTGALEVVQVSPEDLGPAAYPISLEAAQGLLNRFSSDVRVPPGGVFLDLVAS